MTAGHCPRCDDPACDVEPATTDANVYAEAHGWDDETAWDAIYARGTSARRACDERQVDWRARSIAAEARATQAEQERDEARAEVERLRLRAQRMVNGLVEERDRLREALAVCGRAGCPTAREAAATGPAEPLDGCEAGGMVEGE